MPATSPAQKKRKLAPIWLVRRCFFGPNRTQEWRVVGFWRARTQDEAIRKAAVAVKRIAVLQAIKLGPRILLEPPYDYEPEREGDTHAQNGD